MLASVRPPPADGPVGREGGDTAEALWFGRADRRSYSVSGWRVMQRGMRRAALALVGGIQIMLPATGRAGELVSGFGDFRLGMSLTEAQALADLEETAVDYEAVEPVEFLGQPYVLSLAFYDDNLRQVTTSRNFDANPAACESEFMKVLAALVATYGDADGPIERYVTDDERYPYTVWVTITDAEGSVVEAKARAHDVRVLPATCFLAVSYAVPRNGWWRR